MASSHGWRDVRARERSPARRWKQLAVFAVLVGLVGGFIFVLVEPFQHPNAHLIYAIAGHGPDQGVTSPPFALEQYAHLTPLRQALFRGEDKTGHIPLISLAEIGPSGGSTSPWMTSIGDADAVILYLSATEIDTLAGPGLRPVDSMSGQQDIDVHQLIERVRRLPGRTKLLILDTTTPLVPSDGLLLPASFPLTLAEAVQRSGDSSLWVLCSHSLLESTHVSSALRRTVFGYFVARGLKGDADLDRNRVITIAELLAYVRSGVTQWVQGITDGHATQTPQLLWGGGDPAPGDAAVSLLPVASLPLAQRELDVQQSISEARRPRERGQWENLFRRRAATRLLPFTNPIQTKLTEARLPTSRIRGLTTADSASAPSGPSGDSAGDASPPGPQTADSRAQAGTSGGAAAGQQPLEAPQAASGTPRPGEGEIASSEQADDFIVPVNPLDEPQLVDQLARAWSIHDQLLEPRGHAPRPIDYAPDLWWAYQQQLLAIDQTIRGGWSLDTKPLSQVLVEQLLPIEALLESSVPEPPSSRVTGGERPTAERWLEKFLARRPRVTAPEQIRSLAMLIASDSLSLRFDAEAVAALQRYEGLLADGSAEDFARWIEQSWRPEFEVIEELRPAKEFAALAASQWPLVRRMLQNRLLAQRAAVAIASREAFKPLVQRADELRRGGERAVTDRVGQDWQRAAEKQFVDAEGLYDQALRAAEAALEIERTSHDLMAEFPYYVSLQRHANSHPGSPFPTASDLDEMLQELSLAGHEIVRGSIALAELQATADRLRTLRARLRRGLATAQVQRLMQGSFQAADTWFIGLLLRTPLLPAGTRMQLITAAAEIDAASLREETFASVAENARLMMRASASLEDPALVARLAGQRQQAIAWSRWQLELWSLADWRNGDESLFLAAPLREQLANWPTATQSADEFPQAWDLLRQRVTSEMPLWPGRLASVTSQASDLSDPLQRPARIARLSQLQRMMRLVAARIGPPFEPEAVCARLASAHRFDQLAFLAARDQAAMQTAGAGERAWLTASARDYQTLAQSEPRQPALEPIGIPAIEIQTADEVVFAPDQSTLTTGVTIINRGSETTDVWLVVNTDNRYLDIQTSESENLYSEFDLQVQLAQIADSADEQWLTRLTVAEETAANEQPDEGEAELRLLSERVARLRQAAIYPYRPDRADLPATVQLRPGQSKTMSLTLARTDRMDRSTTLTTRAITATDHTRYDTAVLLPDRSAVALSVDAAVATWSDGDNAVTLHPYPNRATPYRLLLHNIRGRELKATVSVLTPHQPLVLSPPATMLSAAAADRWLSQIGAVTQVVAPREITLAADSAVVLLPSPPVDPPQPEQVLPEGAAPGQSEANGTDGASASDEGIAINHGLLVLVHDEATDTTAIQSVRLSPQRPRRYIAPSVGYDVALGRITIDVEATGSAVIPEAGIPVVARVTDDASRPMSLTLSGRILTATAPLRLFADVPQSEDRIVLIEIDVDGFPRAFLFRLHPTASQRSVPEWTQRNRVRLASPRAGTAFVSPLEWIEVSAEVDAPVGSFLDPRDVLQIGVDANRDRVFRNESPLVLRSDRQVDVRLLPGDKDVSVLAHVSDFTVQVPAGPLTDARVNLLGQLRTGDQDTWSDPVEIILDGQPPRLGSIRVLPARSVVEQTPLEISVSADDNDLSGVAGVKIGIATPGTSDFAEDPPPVEAALTPGGAWAAALPTEGLAPGTHNVLLQAIDRVGNRSPVQALGIEILSTVEMLAEKNRPKLVSGRVMHGTTAAAGAVVDLFSTEEPPSLVATRTADDQGNFSFARVVPGTYQLKGRAVVRNNRRRGELEVKVPEGNATAKPVRLLIE